MSIQMNNSKVFKTALALYLSFARGRVTDIFSFQMPLQLHNTNAGSMLPMSYGIEQGCLRRRASYLFLAKGHTCYCKLVCKPHME